MARTEKTKDRFLREALLLFSERGYDAVTLSEIARRVGCVPSALYKHYKNKKELYDAILEESTRGFAGSNEALHVDYDDDPTDCERFIAMTEDDQIDVLKRQFSYLLHDEWAAAFRKLMMLEQFHLKELAEMYNKRYVFSQYDQYAVLFKTLMEEGRLKEADPYDLAVMYVSPVPLLIGVCDRQPDKESWAMERIENHVRTFNRCYRI